MPDPSIFRDMDRAAGRLADAVQAGEQVAIFGDYDVDGATSAALMVRVLRDLGLAARPYIPDRLLEGYGPSGAALVRLATEGATLIVTVDCGAHAFDALAAARGVGLAAFRHRSGLGGVHAVASVAMVVVMGAAGRMAGMPRGTACAAR